MVMFEPMVDGEGISYERSAIEDWLTRSETSPVRRAVVWTVHRLANTTDRCCPGEPDATAPRRSAAEPCTKGDGRRVDGDQARGRSVGGCTTARRGGAPKAEVVGGDH